MTSYYNRRIIFIFILIVCFDLVSRAQAPARDSLVKKQEQIKQISYGEQPAWMVSGSISSVSGIDLQKSFTPNIGNTLYGRIPGLTVRQTGGETGLGLDSPNLNARGLSTFGTGTGLYILIDGYESSFEQLVPDEIESITLLKDASSTAIYGSKGANGVLLVTTIRGEAGPLKVTFSTKQGFQSPTRLPEFLGAYDFARLYNEALVNDGKAEFYAAGDLDAYKNGTDPYYHPDVNWYNEVLRKSVPVANYDLNFTGGNNTINYFVLLNLLNSDGLYIKSGDLSDNSINSEYRRFNYRSNIDINLTSRLSSSLTLGGNIEDKANPAAINTTSIFNLMASIPPNAFPVYNPDGSFGGSLLYSNPLGDIIQKGFYTSNSRTFQGTLEFKEQLDMITEGLSLSAAISFNNYFVGYSSKSRNYMRLSIIKDPVTGNPIYTKIGQNTSLTGNESGSTMWRNYSFRTFLNFNRIFGVNKVDAILLFNSSSYVVSNSGLPYNNKGIYGRFTLANNSKYVGEFSFGYNGSENFPEGKKFGFFPAASAAWIASNEEFLKNNNVVNYLKVRGSYGLTGNDNIGGKRFMYNQDMEYGSSYYLGTSNTSTSTIGESSIANTYVTWEKQKQADFGLEMTLLSRFDITFDLYRQDRYDILAYPYLTIPKYTGMSLPQLNVGKVSNKGFEAVIRYSSDQTKNLQYFVEAGAWYARNKIVYNSEALQINEYLYRTGHQINQPFLLEAIGFFKDQPDIDASPRQIFATVKPGDIKYKDQNDDGLIDQNDYYPTGDTGLPSFTGSLQAGLKFKGFDLSVLFQGVNGRSVYLSGYYFEAFQNNGKVSEIALGRWTSETAETATYPRLSSVNNLNNFQSSSFWQRDGSFIKLRSAELGYSIPGSLLNKVYIDNGRIFINGTNLFSWDHMDFTDPETITGYPVVRTISLGIRVQM